ncbi:SIS domain-containing protein [Jiella marina]|uniref:SIS domain-containing protein n=1 Tax=Jiella sp. LLJ827 TaxID=2917712 RepID=UPI00210195F0|nr:aminotransferase [Jiella sp. LLJ827]MCQ0986303.1 aminotransferase [Jiella sp. LLJ827]
MTILSDPNRPEGLVAIEREMARQMADALQSFQDARDTAATIANSLRRTNRLVMLGMGGSHAVGRTLEPFYRAAGIEAVALPVSEQLVSPLPLEGKTVFLTSQSGESGEVLRWLETTPRREDVYGLTLEGSSSLAGAVTCLVGAGGTERAFAATRSLTITFTQHLAILAALGYDPEPALAALQTPADQPVETALEAFSSVDTIVTSGRLLRGLAETIALGFTELTREPAYALEGGQLRHGPMEMLGPRVGLVQFCADENSADLVRSLSRAAAKAGSPTVVFDASGGEAVPGTVTFDESAAEGMAAVFRLLPLAQRFMVMHAARRVPDVGTPRRSSKITGIV